MTAHKVDPAIRAELAPTGTLRAAIYTRNFLLVNAQGASGDPTGVSPDVARRLGTPLKLISYPDLGLLGDAAAAGEWDIGNIAQNPNAPKQSRFRTLIAKLLQLISFPQALKYKPSKKWIAPTSGSPPKGSQHMGCGWKTTCTC